MAKRLLHKVAEWCGETAPISAILCIALNPEWAARWHWRAILLANVLLIFIRDHRARRTHTLLHRATAQLRRLYLEREGPSRIAQDHGRDPLSAPPRAVIDTTMCEESDAPDDGGARRARGGTPRT